MKKSNLTIIIAVIIGLVGGYLLFSPRFSQGIESHDHMVEGGQNQMWTCSMHPQIMQNNPGQCPLCGMDLTPVDQEGAGLMPNQFKMSDNAMALANVQTTVVGGKIADGNELQLSGKIAENESLNSIQSSYFNGRIETLFVNTTGEMVRQGEKLATIYSPELVAAQQELLTTAGLKETQPELYQAVRNKLKIWKLSESQIQNMEQSGKVSNVVTIYANTSGTVIEKMVNSGDYVKSGQPLFKIANLNSVWAKFDAYESQIPLLKVGQTISISSNAYKNDSREAVITFIEPTLNSSTRTVLVRAELKNSDGSLKPGMFVSGKLKGVNGPSSKEVFVPSSAVMWTGKRSIVYVKPDNAIPVFELREVELGPLVNQNYAIISGLKSGETIVTNGTFTVDAAAQLSGKNSMMGQKNPRQVDTPPGFQSELGNALQAYMRLKEALVQDDVALAAKTSNSLVQELKAIAASSLDMSSMEEWSDKKTILIGLAQQMSEAQGIVDQRKQFIALSEAMTQVVSLFGVGQTVFSQFCPMANNNQGASWLSFEKTIRNPYFGNSMLSCGSIQAELH